MRQLVARPGQNAARQAKKLKEIRKVQSAIVWHERERKKRQKFLQERWESKQASFQCTTWENDNVKNVRKKALANAREDWQLGPLRPNRAIGKEAEKYGTLTAEQVQRPDIPVHTHRHMNELRAKKGLEPEYPLVVDGKKYFHIHKDDRVVVIKGREKGKIGVVKEVVSRTHTVIVTGVNMQYYDSNIFDSVGEDVGPKRENEVPIPIADVRLVIPYKMTQTEKVGNNATGMVDRPVEVLEDVIVDKIHMVRHTTGIDPFTGTDYGNEEIPGDHQYDPATGLPIFHRYVAGTQHRIECPQKEEAAEDSNFSGEPAEDADTKKSSIRRAGGTVIDAIRHPITSLKRLRSKETAVEEAPKVVKKPPEERVRRKVPVRPKSIDPGLHEAWDGTDTTRNIVESAESMTYTLNRPPFPDTLSEELRGNITDFKVEARKDKDAPRPVKIKRNNEQSVLASEMAKAKHVATLRMKTPMQLRWETEQAKKVKMMKTQPLVTTDELMRALGKYKQVKKKAARAASSAEEVE